MPKWNTALKTPRYYVSLQTQGRAYAASEWCCTAAGGEVQVPRGGIQWCSQNEAEEAMPSPETNLLRFLLVLYINLQLLENKQKKQSDLRWRQ